MKYTLIGLLAFSSLSTFASIPSADMMDLTRILFNNPQIGKALRTHCADRLTDYSVTNVKPGVQKFTLALSLANISMNSSLPSSGSCSCSGLEYF